MIQKAVGRNAPLSFEFLGPIRVVCGEAAIPSMRSFGIPAIMAVSVNGLRLTS